ncbi:MAG: hypothetical protein NC336_08425 [Clostridium sp.]|nr:hypothetical protein [Clostridium sp.]
MIGKTKQIANAPNTVIRMMNGKMFNITAYAIVIVLASLYTGCRRVSETCHDDTPVIPEFYKTVDVVVCDSIVIGDVFDLLNWNISDHKLSLQCNDIDSIIRIYDCDNGKLLSSGVSLGQGEGEMIVVNPGDAKDEGHILLYDIMRRQIDLYDVRDDSFDKTDEYALLVDRDGLAYPYTYITQITDSVFLLKMDQYDKSVWHLANLVEGKVVWEYENPIRDNAKSYTPYDFIQVAGENIFAAVYRYIPLIILYDISSSGGPEFRAGYGRLEDQSKIVDYNDLKYDYLSAYICDNKLYCLKSVDGGEWGNVVEVYDVLDAQPFGIISLNKPVVSIRCNDSGDIVGYSPSAENSVFYIFRPLSES